MPNSFDKTLMNVRRALKPQPVPTYRPPQPAKRGWGCGRWFLTGCLFFLCVCGITGAGGFVAYRMNWITAEMGLNLLGMGPGDIEFDNFRDDTLQVSILQLDVAQDSTPLQANLEINAYDIRMYRVQNPGRYRVDFGTTYGGSDLGSCTLTVKSGDLYQFVPMPEKIVVNHVDDPPAAGTDLIVSTSALCR